MADTPDTSLFRIQPLYVDDGVPVFCAHDDYVGNYDQISADHLDALDADGINPFMSADSIDDLEARTVDFALSHQPEINRILDAGVGPGTFLSRIPAAEKHGVDISMGYLKRVKELGISPVLAKLEQLPYADNSFDMVISTDVLEHVLDFLQSTIQLVRVLVEGGTLVVRVPYRENLSAYLDLESYDLVHVRNFDLSSLRVHFEKVLGLEFLGAERLQPHWKGVNQSVFEDLLDRKLDPKDIAVLETLPALKRFGEFHRTLTQDELRKQAEAIEAADPERYQQITRALARHLEVSVAFRKPGGHRFRESLVHLVDPAGRAPVTGSSDVSTPTGSAKDPEHRLTTLEARYAADKAGQRLTDLERTTAALKRDLTAARAEIRSLADIVPEPPRELRKRVSVNGIRKALGL